MKLNFFYSYKSAKITKISTRVRFSVEFCNLYIYLSNVCTIIRRAIVLPRYGHNCLIIAINLLAYDLNKLQFDF